jgi:glycosyltransferase involved in cell wall biosynthesis
MVCPQLNKKIESWGAQAVLVYGWNYHAHYHAMKYFKDRIPVWFRGDSTLLDETGGAKQIIRRTFLKYIYRSADFAFYVGENNRQYYLKHGFGSDRLFFAPHAIDNQRFSDPAGVMRQEAAQWRKELGIGEEETVVLFVGKFEPKKDPEMLIRAAIQLARPGVQYIFTGNGALESSMKAITKDKNQFHFIPFQNQSRMPVVYNLGDILALPSQGPGETWGLTVNEAMACGKAVLVSDKCGCAIDLVVPGKNGYIIPAGNTAKCAEILDQMTASKELTRKMGEFSRQHIASWSFESVCRSFEEHIPGRIRRK